MGTVYGFNSGIFIGGKVTGTENGIYIVGDVGSMGEC